MSIFEGLGSAPKQQGGMDMAQAMRELQAHPAELIKKAGYNVPEKIVNNPQATVMHLIQTGQVGSPMMRQIQPLLGQLIGRR